PTVQILRPQAADESTPNKYSGMFGMNEFPLHTDLAHWARPPRFFILRSLIGSECVSTNLLPASAVIAEVGHDKVRRALTRPRRWPIDKRPCLLPLIFFDKGEPGFRWDSRFLIPVNEPGRDVARVMSNAAQDTPNLLTTKLVQAGDTLIVDNWRMLHGRSRVPPLGLGRVLQRLYLSEL